MSQPPVQPSQTVTGLQSAQGSDVLVDDPGSAGELQEANNAPQPSQQEAFLESLVDGFHDFLLEAVDISALQAVIQVLDEKQLVEIQDLESRGRLREATEKLIQYIKKSKQPGKWKAFFDGVSAVGNDIVVETVLEEKSLSKWHEARITSLRRLFASQIEEKLALDEILPFCMELLPQASIEKIHGLLNKEECRTAIRVFLISITRRKRDWYEKFLEILYDKDHEALARLLDPEYIQQLEDKRKNPAEEGEVPMSLGAESIEQHEAHDESRGGGIKREGTRACPYCRRLVKEVASLRKEITDMKECLKSLEALIARSVVSKGHMSSDADCAGTRWCPAV